MARLQRIRTLPKKLDVQRQTGVARGDAGLNGVVRPGGQPAVVQDIPLRPQQQQRIHQRLAAARPQAPRHNKLAGTRLGRPTVRPRPDGGQVQHDPHHQLRSGAAEQRRQELRQAVGRRRVPRKREGEYLQRSRDHRNESRHMRNPPPRKLVPFDEQAMPTPPVQRKQKSPQYELGAFLLRSDLQSSASQTYE